MNLKTLAFALVLMTANLFRVVAQDQPMKIKVWPNGAPGEIKNEGYKETTNAPNHSAGCLEKVKETEISVYLPKPELSTGAAVLICPGGGYSVVCIQHEGFDVAKWLNENGIAAIVLKYRIPSDLIMKDRTIGPLQDAQEAMRIIRKNATKWNIDAAKVGVLGFSAGGHLASTLSTQFDRKVYEATAAISARPDFSILVYPVISFDESITHMGSRKNLIGNTPNEETVKGHSNELQVTQNTPPAILIHSMDDKAVPVANSVRYFEALNKHNILSELHVYQKGGHGYGLGLKNTGSENQWTATCIQWLRAKNYVKTK